MDIAEQLASIAILLETHPVGSIGAVVIVLLIMSVQKGGILAKWLDLLTARANHDAAKEQRRIEIIQATERREQPRLPGIEDAKEREK